MKNFVLILCLLANASLVRVSFAAEIIGQNAAGITMTSVEDDVAETSIAETSIAEANIAETDSIVANAIDTSDNSVADKGWRAKAQEVLFNAMSLTGIKYTYGGASPTTGFDCSGFVAYVFRQAANLTLPRTALALSQIGSGVQRDELQPGDLVFFNTLQSTFSHVGIYIGNNKFIHAPRTGRNVAVDSMQNSYWSSRYTGAKRLDKELEKSAAIGAK